MPPVLSSAEFLDEQGISFGTTHHLARRGSGRAVDDEEFGDQVLVLVY